MFEDKVKIDKEKGGFKKDETPIVKLTDFGSSATYIIKKKDEKRKKANK